MFKKTSSSFHLAVLYAWFPLHPVKIKRCYSLESDFMHLTNASSKCWHTNITHSLFQSSKCCPSRTNTGKTERSRACLHPNCLPFFLQLYRDLAHLLKCFFGFFLSCSRRPSVVTHCFCTCNCFFERSIFTVLVASGLKTRLLSALLITAQALCDSPPGPKPDLMKGLSTLIPSYHTPQQLPFIYCTPCMLCAPPPYQFLLIWDSKGALNADKHIIVGFVFQVKCW